MHVRGRNVGKSLAYSRKCVISSLTASQGVLATRSHVSLVSTTILSTGPSLRLQDACLSSLTASSIISATSAVVSESSCIIAHKASFRGNLNSALHASESFLVLLECSLTRADLLLSAGKSSRIFAVDCSFMNSRLGIRAHSGAALFLSRCSLTMLKEHALSATGCSATFHQCRVSAVECQALNVMGQAYVHTVDCYFDKCKSVALVAGLLPAEYETYLKFLWRWKRSASKEMHAAITLQLQVAPSVLVLGFDKPQDTVVHVMQGGCVECDSGLARHDLYATADERALSADDEVYVEDELNRVKINREKLLARFVSMMGLNSQRLAFDRWSISAAAAANERMLAEEAAKLEMAEPATASSESENGDDEGYDEEVAADACEHDLVGGAAVKERLRKKTLRRQLRRQLQVAQDYALLRFCYCYCYCYCSYCPFSLRNQKPENTINPAIAFIELKSRRDRTLGLARMPTYSACWSASKTEAARSFLWTRVCCM